MKNNKRTIITLGIILSLFFIYSIVSIYSFSGFILDNKEELVIKQVIFYLLGIISIIIIYKIGIDKILKYSLFIYIFNIILLILVLIFGSNINGSRAWFTIPFLGSFQPSEFAKIGIILLSAKVISDTKIKDLKDEFKLILKIFIIVLIPSILTFLEPDTGGVIMYFVAGILMLFVSNIRMRWFILAMFILFLVGGIFLYIFYYKDDLFIKIFGSSMFYRLDRLFDWSKSSGMQLENSIISIGASGIFGHGSSSILLYYPEGHTDFIFTSFVSCFGFLGACILIITIVVFDLKCINIACNSKDVHKLVIMGFLGIFMYQQIQNIAMTLGLLPITGITLPFISYGGSSLLSSMIGVGLIISTLKDEKRLKY